MHKKPISGVQTSHKQIINRFPREKNRTTPLTTRTGIGTSRNFRSNKIVQRSKFVCGFLVVEIFDRNDDNTRFIVKFTERKENYWTDINKQTLRNTRRHVNIFPFRFELTWETSISSINLSRSDYGRLIYTIEIDSQLINVEVLLARLYFRYHYLTCCVVFARTTPCVLW